MKKIFSGLSLLSSLTFIILLLFPLPFSSCEDKQCSACNDNALTHSCSLSSTNSVLSASPEHRQNFGSTSSSYSSSLDVPKEKDLTKLQRQNVVSCLTIQDTPEGSPVNTLTATPGTSSKTIVQKSQNVIIAGGYANTHNANFVEPAKNETPRSKARKDNGKSSKCAIEKDLVASLKKEKPAHHCSDSAIAFINLPPLQVDTSHGGMHSRKADKVATSAALPLLQSSPVHHKSRPSTLNLNAQVQQSSSLSQRNPRTSRASDMASNSNQLHSSRYATNTQVTQELERMYGTQGAVYTSPTILLPAHGFATHSSPTHKPKSTHATLPSSTQFIYSYGSTPGVNSPMGGAHPSLAHQGPHVHYKSNIPGHMVPPTVLHSPTLPAHPRGYHPTQPGPHQFHQPQCTRPVYLQSPSGNIYSTYPLSPTKTRPYPYLYQGLGGE